MRSKIAARACAPTNRTYDPVGGRTTVPSQDSARATDGIVRAISPLITAVTRRGFQERHDHVALGRSCASSLLLIWP